MVFNFDQPWKIEFFVVFWSEKKTARKTDRAMVRSQASTQQALVDDMKSNLVRVEHPSFGVR